MARPSKGAYSRAAPLIRVRVPGMVKKKKKAVVIYVVYDVVS